MSDRLDDLAFRVRGALRWSAPVWKLRARSFDRVVASLPSPQARARARALAEQHDLGRWPKLLTARELRENLYVLDVLASHLPGALPDGPALDVGSKNGAVLPALVAARPRPWHLVELDAHRRYLDGSTRRAHGEAIAAAFPGCRYFARSVADVEGRYAAVTWFLPYVRQAPLRAAGLPSRCFEPERLLRHVAGLVAPSGVLLVLNQGERERDEQARLFAQLGLAPEALGVVDSPLSPFVRARYGFRWQRRS